MVDIEQNKLSDGHERHDTKDTYDLEIGLQELDKLAHEKLQQEQEVHLLVQKESAIIKDTIDLSYPIISSPIKENSKSLSSFGSSISDRIQDMNPDSSSVANEGREKSYAHIQSQISNLPFGLDKYFVDA